ncbi:MAG: hypothetical protein M3270_05540, partial [Thermoproteota archaeon]|nr:hypothetical protein [Thermoproteota archaeon]
VLPQQFEVWIGEPLEDDNALSPSKRNQRMSEVLAEIDNISSNRARATLMMMQLLALLRTSSKS